MHGSCSEMGSAKVHGVELVEKGAVVLLIICIVSQGTQYFFFLATLKTVCSARTVRQSPALISSCSRCLK